MYRFDKLYIKNNNKYQRETIYKAFSYMKMENLPTGLGKLLGPGHRDQETYFEYPLPTHHKYSIIFLDRISMVIRYLFSLLSKQQKLILIRGSNLAADV